MISAQAPSDSTNPSRWASNGREATSGSGFFVRAVICENAATVIGSVADSEPPAMHRSSVPSRSRRIASKIAWLLDEHAEMVAKFAPVSPNVMAMCPAGAFAMSIGTMNGDTRPGPFGLQHVVRVQERLDAADPRREDHPAAFGDDLRVAGVGPCELGRGDAELREAVGPASLLRVQVIERVEVDLTRDGDRQVVDREPRDRADAVPPAHEPLPEVVDARCRPA